MCLPFCPTAGVELTLNMQHSSLLQVCGIVSLGEVQLLGHDGTWIPHRHPCVHAAALLPSAFLRNQIPLRVACPALLLQDNMGLWGLRVSVV